MDGAGQDRQDWSGPIFVCGPSRSGTALVRSILNSHSRIHLAGETHYFDDLRVRLGPGATSPLAPDEERLAQDYFLSLSHRPYGHQGDPEKGRLRRDQLVEAGGGTGRTGDEWFETYCRLETAAASKRVWGEKTPRHVFRIREILSAFPDARIICLVRDARAIVASYRDWKNQGGFDLEADPTHAQALEVEERRAKQSYHPIIMSMLWKGAMLAAVDAHDEFGAHRVRLQRYEELAFEPEASIRELNAWLGLPYEPAMAAPPMHNSSYARFQDHAGVSRDPVDRWRTKLNPGEIATVEAVCGALLRRLGYDEVGLRGTRLSVAWNYCTFPFGVARAALANRKRIPNLPQYALRRLKLATTTRRPTSHG